VNKQKNELKLCPSCNVFQDATKMKCPNCGHNLTNVKIVESESKKSKDLLKGHRGTFFLACVIIWIFYLVITGHVPGLKQGLYLAIPAFLVKGLIDTSIDLLSEKK